jgi:hypothetical protein
MNSSSIDRAITPNLFDAILDPELIFALVLANLMSPRLWELRRRLLQSSGPGDPTFADSIQRIQQLIDHHFEHVTPARIAEVNGVLDLDREAERLGSAAVDYAVSKILSTLDWRVRRGTLAKDVFPVDLIGRRKFPAYIYSTIDEAWASRRLLQRRKHKPLGLTCCLDEAAIFIALKLLLPQGGPDELALLGSPAHYSVLAWTAEEAWWFYAKHELHSVAAWSLLVAEKYAGDAQMAFDDRLPNFDRIISVSGTFTFAAGATSISEPHLAAIVAKIDGFFGCRLSQLDRALHGPVQPMVASDLAQTIVLASSAADATMAQSRLRYAALEGKQPAALRALYAFRVLDLPDLQIYLRAARRSSQISDIFGPIATVDDALRIVAAIPGDTSIFEDPDRIAMPDETARFATGTDRDKALLLHVLLERALGPDDAVRAKLETLMTDTGSYVRSPRFCITTSPMAYVSQVEGKILHRIADW